ncbi:Dihydrodipicolinate synthetase [uncultured delta proteobacterium]|uniref:Dihydrodipicolinate synthetase n=1 Tax=uncultured delta proteobacterium TaxID=34034 RepID=A0A212JN05_9DELT|nr:Dihydrodipicolinate synthetase [uncultured delta proteobacterium]
MSTAIPRLRGVLSPVLTPFKANLDPSPERFLAHCKRLVDAGVGLAIFGTNSEANSLSVQEKLDLLEYLLASGIPAERLMPGTGCCALTDSVTLTRAAVARGCGGVLMLPPFYYKEVSVDGLFRSYSEIIQRVGNANLRLYLYHIPPIAVVPISAELIERLLKAYPGTVAGIKDSSGDWSNTEMLLKNFQSESFDVFCGSEVFLLQNMRGGGAGCITATANTNAPAIMDMYNSWKTPEADAKQAAITATRKAFAKLPMIASMKAVIARELNDPEWAMPRPPLMPCAPDKVDGVMAELKSLGYKYV